MDPSQSAPSPSREKSRSSAFVKYILDLCQRSTGQAAALKRADNPATEYQSWEVLAGFKINLENPWERLPHALVAAALAKYKVEANGTAGLGEALAKSYDHNSDQGKAKLRRLLACQSTEEVCQVLRPLLSLIEHRPHANLDYARLLEQLNNFNLRSQKIRTEWAQSFFHHQDKNQDQKKEE